MTAARKKRRLITLKVETVNAGSEYAAGALIYEVTDEGEELFQVASLYIAADTRVNAAQQAVKELLCAIEDGCKVVILSYQMNERGVKILNKLYISAILASKGLEVFTSNNELDKDRAQLIELCEDASARKQSIIANI